MKYKNILLTLLFTILTTISFFLNIELIYKDMFSLKEPFIEGTFVVTIFSIGIFYFYFKNKDKKISIFYKLLAILYSLFMIFGNSYKAIASWNFIFGSPLMFLISIIMFIGYYIFFTKLISFILYMIEKTKIKNIDNKFTKFIFDKHPFLIPLIIIIICWLPYIIAYYPIILSPDPSFQIKQFLGVKTKYLDYIIPINDSVTITNHHPVLHTVLLGLSLKIGMFLGNDNFGLFIYSMIQILILAGTLAYTIKYMKKLNINNSFKLIVLAIYCFVPMFPFYSMSGVKDVIFTSFIILYIVKLYDIIHFNQKLTLKDSIIFLTLLLLIAMFRNNGMYVIVLSLPFLLIFKNNRKNIAVILVLFLTLYMGYSKLLLPTLGISEGSIREMLSIPFQQTARYVNNHDDLSDSDIKIIDHVLGYQNMLDNYDPEFADPVKNNYNRYTTDEELKEYFKIWFKGLIKHPTTYIEATINNTYGYFYPNSSRWYIYTGYDKRITEDNLVDYHFNGLKGIRNVLSGYGVSFPFLPIVGLISNIGFNGWILLFISILLIDKKKYKYLIFLLPSLVSLLICIASPVNTYFRYTMPYIFSMPIILILIYNIFKEKRS